jgi:hypothetical protein
MRSRVPIKAVKTPMITKSLRLALPVIILTFLWFFPSRAQNMKKQSLSQVTSDVQCIANLKDIYKMIKLYLHHSGRALGFPTNLDEIYLMTKDANLFTCSADNQINSSLKKGAFRTSYGIVNDPLKQKFSTTPAYRLAIVAEEGPNHNGKRFVLFYDGSVRAFDEKQFNTLRNNSFIDLRAVDKNR